jgi:hypothetical protein
MANVNIPKNPDLYQFNNRAIGKKGVPCLQYQYNNQLRINSHVQSIQVWLDDETEHCAEYPAAIDERPKYEVDEELGRGSIQICNLG